MSESIPFYVTGGTLPPDAASYIPRVADTELLAALQKGELCYVLNARQMGKSSLSVRTRQALETSGTRTSFLDLQKFGSSATAEQWYRSLLERIGNDLKLRPQVLAYWRDNSERAPLDRLFGAIRDVALEQIPGNLVIFLDEIDVVRDLAFKTDEFFGAIRETHNARADDKAFERLTFCIIGTVAPTDLIRDIRLSPFNVGTRIRLLDFTPTEAAPLAGPLPGGNATLTKVLAWTSGHPYLTQRLCAELTTTVSSDVDGAVARLFLAKSDAEVDENIKNVRNGVLRMGGEGASFDRTDLLNRYGAIVSGKKVVDDDTDGVCTALRLSGLVTSSEGLLRPRCRVYATLFDAKWVRDNLPDAELRRQRVAVAKARLQLGSIATAVLFIMGGLLWQTSKAELRATASAEKAAQRAKDAVTSALAENKAKTEAQVARNIAQTSAEKEFKARRIASKSLIEENKARLLSEKSLIALNQSNRSLATSLSREKQALRDVERSRRMIEVVAGLVLSGGEYQRLFNQLPVRDKWEVVKILCRISGDKWPDVGAAQWAFESDFGRISTGDNNFFGIKASNYASQYGSSVVRSMENGAAIKDLYSNFMTLFEGVEARSYLLKESRYSGYLTSHSIVEACAALEKSRYSDHPNYSQALLKVINQMNHSQLVQVQPSKTLVPRNVNYLKIRLNLDLKDAPLRAVLENILNQAGVRYEISPLLNGVVTLKVSDQSFENTLKLVLRSSSTPLKYHVDRGIYIFENKSENDDTSDGYDPNNLFKSMVTAEEQLMKWQSKQCYSIYSKILGKEFGDARFYDFCLLQLINGNGGSDYLQQYVSQRLKGLEVNEIASHKEIASLLAQVAVTPMNLSKSAELVRLVETIIGDSDEYCLFSSGAILYRELELERSVNLLERAAQLNKDRGETKIFLALAYNTLGNKVASRRWFDLSKKWMQSRFNQDYPTAKDWSARLQVLLIWREANLAIQ